METKPSINLLFNAFQKFALATAKVGYNVVSWRLAREELKKDLAVLEIADKFDWSEQ